MLSREDFVVCKDGQRYKVEQVIYIPHPFSPGAIPSRQYKLIESGLTRIQAERRIYEYIIEQMTLEYENRIRTLTERKFKKEVEQLLMKIAGLEKLVETADKLLKPKGGFTIKDVKFGGVKLEGIKEADK